VMLWFEREVVGALIDSPEQPVRSAVEAFVDGTLRDMPEHLRLGVVGESVLLGVYVAALRRAGRLPAGDRHALLALLDRWEASPIGPLQAYVRLLKSLVVLAENEMAPEGPR
ncbi:MAG TPA: hypothetical protein VFI44_04375, partial [Ornithinibacter sp.]|nr:hypothetical protein [Ornithinibacter sp.]